MHRTNKRKTIKKMQYLMHPIVSLIYICTLCPSSEEKIPPSRLPSYHLSYSEASFSLYYHSILYHSSIYSVPHTSPLCLSHSSISSHPIQLPLCLLLHNPLTLVLTPWCLPISSSTPLGNHSSLSFSCIFSSICFHSYSTDTNFLAIHLSFILSNLTL